MTSGMSTHWRETTTFAAEQERFEGLVSQNRGIAFKVATAYVRDSHDRQDLVQQILTEAWRAFPTFDASRKFSTWLYRIALNVAISHQRGAIVRARVMSPLEDATLATLAGPPPTDPDGRIRELHRVIDALDDFSRALVVLYLEGYDQRETAEILGLTETNVATRLSRLRQRLRRDVSAGPAASQETAHGTR